MTYTNEELKDFLEGPIWYSYWQMKNSHILINNSNLSTININLKNAVIESGLLHARILIEFFTDNPKADDCSVKHFFQDKQDRLSEVKNTLSEYLKNLKIPLNKRLAHITKQRISITQEEKSWDIPRVTSEIEETMSAFINRLDKEILSEEFKKKFQSLLHTSLRGG